MKLVTFSVVLNQHQAPVADALWELTSHQFCFVELINLGDTKGGSEDYSKRPYLLRAWESPEAHNKAMEHARNAECCIFSGVDALPYQKERMSLGLLSFDMGERWLKHGWKSLASPRLLKWLTAYYLGGWSRRPLYKLCMSAFAASDHYKLGTFKGKCYKWGYITEVGNYDVEASSDVTTSEITPLMWCSRIMMLKHPELPILMAQKLKDKDYKFHLDMYGDGECRPKAEALVSELHLDEYVTIHGNVPNQQVREAMKKSEIFLFTSDRYEGWGAVANESLSCGCALVASDAIGSSPYLIKNEYNGYTFHSSCTNASFDNPDLSALDDLTMKVMFLLDNRDKLYEMRKNAIYNMQNLWSPQHAAKNLLQLIHDLQSNSDTSISVGPCSKS